MALHLVLGGDFWNQCVNCTCAGPDDSPSEITLFNFQRLASLFSSFASSTHPSISSLSNRMDRLLTRKLDSGKMVTACLLSQDPEIRLCALFSRFTCILECWRYTQEVFYAKMIAVERLGETGSREHERRMIAINCSSQSLLGCSKPREQTWPWSTSDVDSLWGGIFHWFMEYFSTPF